MCEGTPHFLKRWIFCVLVALLLCGPCGQCCGPGRGGGRRRSPRKLTPLVFKQHVPNVAENTLGASGLTEGRITRKDERFHQLVPNYNADIYFKDEEGTGADRLMTERCKEKLNTLSISVMNHWPGVRLYVFEAWDNGTHHEPHSLHFEGRAVDIATTDRDRSKLGMLARLAVEAGFDWVYYESRSHIHCSVKSESTSTKRLGGCFPSNALVDTPSGRKPMGALQEGDLVKVLTKEGHLKFSPVLMFLHKDSLASRSFLSLVTEEASITLTPSHLVFLLRQEDANQLPDLAVALTKGQAVLAGTVRSGDYLISAKGDGGRAALTQVIDLSSHSSEGVFAPLTEEGTVVVNSIVASCYAMIDSHPAAHWAFLPVRMYFSVKDTLLSLLYSIGVISQRESIISPRESTISPEYSKSSQFPPMTKFLDKIPQHRIIFPPTAVKYKNVNINSLHSLNDNKKDVYRGRRKGESDKDENFHHIHWYAKFLYKVASLTLPNHLVYS